jgi:hypothetical protein
VTDAADIDALLAAPKTLSGSPHWAHDPTSRVVRLAAPVAVNGVVGSLVLQATATLETDPQRGSAVLIYEGRPVQRISIRPDHPHANPFAAHTPATHRGVRLPPERSRIHPWRINRMWPRPRSDNVSIGELIEGDVGSIAEGLTIFLAACGIEGTLPTPPWEPRLL